MCTVSEERASHGKGIYAERASEGRGARAAAPLRTERERKRDCADAAAIGGEERERGEANVGYLDCSRHRSRLPLLPSEEGKATATVGRSRGEGDRGDGGKRATRGKRHRGGVGYIYTHTHCIHHSQTHAAEEWRAWMERTRGILEFPLQKDESGGEDESGEFDDAL